MLSSKPNETYFKNILKSIAFNIFLTILKFI